MKEPKAKRKRAVLVAITSRKDWMELLDLANAQPPVQHRRPNLRTR